MMTSAQLTSVRNYFHWVLFFWSVFTLLIFVYLKINANEGKLNDFWGLNKGLNTQIKQYTVA